MNKKIFAKNRTNPFSHQNKTRVNKENKKAINIRGPRTAKKIYFENLKKHKNKKDKKITYGNIPIISYIYKSGFILILLFIFILMPLYFKKNDIEIGPIKVGYYVYSMRNGGIERVFSVLIKHLSKEKYFIFYLITRVRRKYGEYPIPNSTRRIVLLNQRMNLYQALEKEHIDILIYNYENKEINNLKKLKKTKVIYYNHSSFLYWIYQQHIYKFENSVYNMYKDCKYVISLIPLEHDYLLKRWGINSILMDNPSTFEYDSIIPSDLSNKNIIMIGRVDRVKRYHLGIIAMETIIKEIPECQMIIVSEVDGNLKNLVKKLNLENNTLFMGYQENIEKYLKNSSLHILASENESYSMVLTEVKIFGIPSIICGLDFLTLAKGGTIIVYDDDPDTIAKEAIKILKDDKYRKRLGKEARNSMKNRKNELIAKRWVKIFLSVYKGDDKSYQKLLLSNNNDKVSENEAKEILNNQLHLLQKRRSRFKSLTFEQLINFSIL